MFSWALNEIEKKVNNANAAKYLLMLDVKVFKLALINKLRQYIILKQIVRVFERIVRIKSGFIMILDLNKNKIVIGLSALFEKLLL